MYEEIKFLESKKWKSKIIEYYLNNQARSLEDEYFNRDR